MFLRGLAARGVLAPPPSPLDLATADQLVDALNTRLDAPHVRAHKSTLGGAHRVSVLVTASLDPRETWVNGILQNSRYFTLHILTDWTIEEVVRVARELPFRRSKAKGIDDVVARVNKYIAVAQEAVPARMRGLASSRVASTTIRSTQGGVPESLVGKTFWYSYKESWGTRYYSFDGEETWHKTKTDAFRAAHEAGKLHEKKS